MIVVTNLSDVSSLSLAKLFKPGSNVNIFCVGLQQALTNNLKKIDANNGTTEAEELRQLLFKEKNPVLKLIKTGFLFGLRNKDQGTKIVIIKSVFVPYA